MSGQHWTPDAQHQAILAHNGLDSFADVWALKADWFEAPNERRSGWSGASRVELKTPDGGTLAVFLKRQQDHDTRSLRHPFGQPTFRREFHNIRKLQALGIPAVPLVYYGEQRINGHSCAALMTVALDAFQSLDEWWASHPQADSRAAVLTAIADWAAQISKQRWQHGCLYDKHIFVRTLSSTGQFGRDDIRLIDLEKMRRRLTVNRAAEMNIRQLMRHSQCCSPAEHQLLEAAFAEHMKKA